MECSKNSTLFENVEINQQFLIMAEHAGHQKLHQTIVNIKYEVICIRQTRNEVLTWNTSKYEVNRVRFRVSLLIQGINVVLNTLTPGLTLELEPIS